MQSRRSLTILYCLLGTILCCSLNSCDQGSSLYTGSTCSAKVIEENGSFRIECEGACGDGSPCVVISDTSATGAIRQWCGCGDAVPDSCHIELYYPAPGEGEVQVRCAGNCRPGTECTIRRNRIAWYREFFCRCSDEPIPDKGCLSVVIERGDKYTLECRGACSDGAECRIVSETNDKGGVLSWCACDGSDKQPEYCHVTLYVPGRGEMRGPSITGCGGSCSDEQLCRLESITIIEKAEYWCECSPID